jgi:hypothetical protein
MKESFFGAAINPSLVQGRRSGDLAGAGTILEQTDGDLKKKKPPSGI